MDARPSRLTAPTGTPAISVRGVTKTYPSGLQALHHVDLDIQTAEIFALLRPKTTLISIICGLANPSRGSVLADGHDVIAEYRAARRRIGLVPQEMATEAFETVLATVRFSRGLFGRRPDPGYVEKVLRDLSLWDKRHTRIMTLSGGMKRRVMIAKALSHEPGILFLDEPTAGVDVELRQDMWRLVRTLRASGVTIFLTTHYIEEAEQIADRIGVISDGRLILVEDKATLMNRLGISQLRLTLRDPLPVLPEALSGWGLSLAEHGTDLTYSYDPQAADNGIAPLLRQLDRMGIGVKDLHTHRSTLEDIFVGLMHAQP